MRDTKQERMDAMFEMAERGGTENEREQAKRWIETKTGKAYSEAVGSRGGAKRGPREETVYEWANNKRSSAHDFSSFVDAVFGGTPFYTGSHGTPFTPRDFNKQSGKPYEKPDYTPPDFSERFSRAKRNASYRPGGRQYTFDSYLQWAHETLPMGATAGPLFVPIISGNYHRMTESKKADYEAWKEMASEFGLEFIGDDRRDY